jgi:hypothetical protein
VFKASMGYIAKPCLLQGKKVTGIFNIAGSTASPLPIPPTPIDENLLNLDNTDHHIINSCIIICAYTQNY